MKCDFLFLMEHEDREAETINLVVKELELSGFIVKVLSIEFHAYMLIFFEPKCVVFPYAISDDSWPVSYFKNKRFCSTQLVSLNWEQLISNSNKDFKRPKGVLLTKVFKHLSWGGDYCEFLKDAGVDSENIAVLGCPANDVLFSALKRKKILLQEIKREYSISDDYNITFFPMNYGWAFLSDRVISEKIKMGYEERVAWEYRAYSKRCLRRFISFVYEYALSVVDTFVVIRPHPSVSVSSYRNAFLEQGFELPKNILISKDRSIRDWMVVSNLVGSSWSTSVWDAVNVGIPGFLYTPEPRPEWLETFWNSKVTNISSVGELLEKTNFKTFNTLEEKKVTEKLSQWLIDLLNEEGIGLRCQLDVDNFRNSLYLARSLMRSISMKYLSGFAVHEGMQRDYFNFREYNS